MSIMGKYNWIQGSRNTGQGEHRDFQFGRLQRRVARTSNGSG